MRNASHGIAYRRIETEAKRIYIYDDYKSSKYLDIYTHPLS